MSDGMPEDIARSRKRPSSDAPRAYNEKRERRLEQNRQAAKRSYNKRIAAQNEMEREYHNLCRDIDWIQKGLKDLESVLELTPFNGAVDDAKAMLGQQWPRSLTKEQREAIGRIRTVVTDDKGSLGSVLSGMILAVLDAYLDISEPNSASDASDIPNRE